MTNAAPDKRKPALSKKFNLDNPILTEKISINQLLLLIGSHQLTKVIQMIENTVFTNVIAPTFFNSSLQYLEVD